MQATTELYGRALHRGKRDGLAAQLYDVLRHEILLGRWALGERIPSYKDITEQTGLSQKPIQKALSQLEKDGYVECIRHKGVFVKATATPSNRTLGTVIIAVPTDSPLDDEYHQPMVNTQGFGLISVGHFMKAAKALGLRTRVALVGDDPTWLPTDDAVGEDLFGVISLLPDRQIHQRFGTHPPERVLYLGVDDPVARPCVTGDPSMAAYLVTRELFRQGHRKIALLPDPGLHAAADEAVRRGIAEARREAGMATDDLPELAHSGAPIPADVSAVFCFSVGLARGCIVTAEANGRPVPTSLSVASLQEGGMPLPDGREIMGAGYQWNDIIATCFDILLAPESFAGRSMTTMGFEPALYYPDSIAPPFKPFTH